MFVKIGSKPDAKQTHQTWLKTLHRTGGIGWLQRKDVDVVGGVSRTLERAAAIDYPLHIIRGPVQLEKNTRENTHELPVNKIQYLLNE